MTVNENTCRVLTKVSTFKLIGLSNKKVIKSNKTVENVPRLNVATFLQNESDFRGSDPLARSDERRLFVSDIDETFLDLEKKLDGLLLETSLIF